MSSLFPNLGVRSGTQLNPPWVMFLLLRLFLLAVHILCRWCTLRLRPPHLRDIFLVFILNLCLALLSLFLLLWSPGHMDNTLLPTSLHLNLKYLKTFFSLPKLNKLCFCALFTWACCLHSWSLSLSGLCCQSTLSLKRCGHAGLGRTVLVELLWCGCNKWAQMTPFWVCLSTVMWKKNADQTFAYLHVELCVCGKGLQVAWWTHVCKTWSSVLAV